MGLKIAHFPRVKTLKDFDFELQPVVSGQKILALDKNRIAVDSTVIARATAARYHTPKLARARRKLFGKNGS